MVQNIDERKFEEAMERARRASARVREAQSELAGDLAELRAELERAERARETVPSTQS
ncbi:MAG TPA: hypothetical protein VEL07_20410 [Planctomycetota bacterium]|nr:hypothetical protein [Planctomycetota bacterium]